ncbi:MAG: hypothetical protein ABI663_18195 [Chryseolinea sp.]
MIDPEKDISNLDLPIAQVIRQALSDLLAAQKKELLLPTSENDFISHRVDIYLQSLETAMHAGFDEVGAKEIALKDCLHDLIQNDGEVLET